MTADTHTSTGPGPLLDHALRYAAAGVPLVPLFEPDGHGGCTCRDAKCRRPGKHPRTPDGLKNASTDPDTVAAWWQRWPGANIGGLTGVMFDVCDVDGPQGVAAVTPLLEADHGRGPLARTGSGGWHLLFKPTGMGNRVGFLPSTDWRGRKGYIVMAPSLHACGQRYAFVRPLHGELPPVPPALLAALAPAPAAARTTAPPDVARHSGYGPAALHREAERVATTPKEGRNDQLNRSAFNLGQLIASGHLTEAEVTEELTRAAAHAGLGKRETARTITSGLTAGQQCPRTPRTTRRAA
jgi:hypothetical protein